jgi:hypothetical protein
LLSDVQKFTIAIDTPIVLDIGCVTANTRHPKTVGVLQVQSFGPLQEFAHLQISVDFACPIFEIPV